MNSFESLKIKTPALDAVRQLQEKSALAAIRKLQVSSEFAAALELETTGAFAAVRELQSTIKTMKLSTSGSTAALEEYRKIVTPISESIKAINAAYAPIFEQTRAFDSLNIKGILAGLQTSSAAMSAISGLNLSGIASIIDALPKYDFLSDIVSEDFSVTAAEELYENGEITQDDINEEISEIVSKKQFSPKAEWDKIKKSKWFLAIKILIILVTFVCNPVTEYATDKALEKLGINEFWENSGVYDIIDSIFGEEKEGAVSEMEAKATVDKGKTGNISKQKREELLAKIKEIRTFISAAPQDENTGNLLSYLSDLEKDVNGKKYGLVFEEHREDIDEVLATHTSVLTEQSDLFIDNGGEMNFLIEGDNLASLQLLEKTHKGKIDVIYIDPPYNTLNDGFTYSDSLVDGNDTFRHSKWLSFMKERLAIARKLMSNEGVIFISVDENEFAQIKLLCDEVFNENNFIECIVWNKRVPKNDKGIGNIHEYILTYAKSSEFKYKFMVLKDGLKDIDDLLHECKKNGVSIEETELRLKKLYKKNNYDRAITLYNAVDENYRVWGKINMSWPNGNTFGPRYNVIHPATKKPVRVPDRGWRWSEESFLAAVDYENVVKRFDGSYMCGNIWFSKDENMQPSSIKYLDEVNRMLLRSIISLKSDGGIELEKYFEKKSVFAYPKSVELLRMLLDSITYNNKECMILDFFAGSGTTGQAVMKLNAEDDGKRKFILCTNNENNICRDVTYERIKRVIDKEGYSASVKYYKVDYIPVSERMYYEYADELLMHIRELVELENGVNFTGNVEIGIVLTEEDLDEFIANTDAFVKCRKLYMGHDILPSDEQEEVLHAQGIEISIIPDYYYRNLQEG